MKTVFFDIDTQLDFMLPGGALYVPGAESIVGGVSALNRYAAERGIPVVSTTDAHAEDDPEFLEWPAHCIAGTLGQQKPAATLLRRPMVIPSSGRVQDFPNVEQFVIEKQRLDLFTNENLPALLAVLGADRYVVYGVVTELCVRFAAMGLLETGKRVELVEDAVRHLADDARRQMLAAFAARGGVVTTAAHVMV